MIPIQISKFEEKNFDFELILNQVKEIVKEYLPEGKYHGVVYKDDCDKILNGKGELVFQFIQVKHRFLSINPQVLAAYADIDTQSGMVEISIKDVSNFYPNLDEYLEIGNEDFPVVLSTADQFLKANSIDSCKVVITQFKDSWNVLCYPLNEEDRQCAFSIDPKSFEIIEYKPPR